MNNPIYGIPVTTPLKRPDLRQTDPSKGDYVLGREMLFDNATPIVGMVTGETISVADASDHQLYGLTIYGNTAQNGTPAPASPASLVSAGNRGNIVVTVSGADAEQTISVPTPDGLPGIPVDGGWISDEVDFGRGVYVQRVNKVVLTATDNWLTANTIKGVNILYLQPTFPLAAAEAGLCTHFPYDQKKAYGGQDGYIGAEVSNVTGKSRIWVSTTMTAAEFKSFLAENPVTVMYPMAEPVETALNDDLLAEFAKLHSYKPNTTVTNDAGAEMKLEYVADTKTYVDDRYSELAEAIVNGGTGGGSGQNGNQSGQTALDTFLDNTDVDYAYDETTGAYYTVIRIYKQKLDGGFQYPFVYAPNGADAGDKSTYDMTATDGWLLAINSGIFDMSTNKPDGIVIQNGVVIQNTQSVGSVQCKPLTIDVNGNLGYAAYDADAAELVADGIISAVCGFMPIIVDYDVVPESDWNSVTHYTQNAQRQIIGQWGNGDYAIITCEGRSFHNSDGWTIAEAQAICQKHGLKFAYNLDGGGSTETMLGLKHINTIYENVTGRIVPTFIVFNGTTVPPTINPDAETGKTLTSISATYTGGDVAVGTAINNLTGIVVTAAYDDGSTAVVTGYTLNGTIIEGSNTITVSYGGKTTTFTVIGVADDNPDANVRLYSLPQETVFDGDDYIDTGVQLAVEDIDFTIAFEATPGAQSNVPAVVMHCVHEVSPYPGYCFTTHKSIDVYRFGAYDSYDFNRTNIPKAATSKFKAVITHKAGSGLVTMKTLYNGVVADGTANANAFTWTPVTEHLLIGAYQDDTGNKGRYWKGTMHDFVIDGAVWSGDKISAYLT